MDGGGGGTTLDRMPPDKAKEEMRRLTAGRPSQDPAWFEFEDRTVTPAQVTALLEPYLSDRRMARIEDVLDHRTYNVAVVLEGLVDTGNVSAVMRTADAFGIQTFHLVDNAGSYKHSRRTSQGAEKWLDRYRWATPAECIAHLHRDGYRILAAHPADSATDVGAVDFSGRTALVFGNELGGLSSEFLGEADELARIPIDGFVQSFNVSVAAALCLSHARRWRVDNLGHQGDLTAADRDRLRAVFYMKSVPNSRSLLARLIDQEPAGT